MAENYFKAFIRVVKSLNKDNNDYMGFDTVQIISEPLIIAETKDDVKKYILSKYPQFFPTGKVYEKETKDQAQFFYVVIFKLYQHEIDLIKEGEWKCDQCGHVHENKYISRPIRSKKFDGKLFCGADYYTGNDLVDHSCYEQFKRDHFSSVELPDDLHYVSENSSNWIYRITEKSSGKCYIGKTRNAPFFRWWNHLKHSTSPFGVYLRTTKLSDWTFEVLEELPFEVKESTVLEIESKYIIQYNSIDNGFNTLISNKEVLLKHQQPELFQINQ